MLKATHKDAISSVWGKTAALVVCAVLLLCFAVGATFAYLWDKSDTYVNTFTAQLSPDPLQDAGFVVKGEKRLDGRDWAEGDAFEFHLERYAGSVVDESGQSAPVWEKVSDQAVETVAYSPNSEGFDAEKFHEFDFADAIGELEFTQEGDHLFRIVEQEGSLPGMAYVKDPVEFTVHVAKNADASKLELAGITLHDGTAQGVSLSKSEESGLYEVPASFLNTYSVTGSVQVSINILKSIEDKSVADAVQSKQSLAGYRFALYQVDESFAVGDNATVVDGGLAFTNAAGEAAIRIDYAPSDAGKTYRYVLREQVPSTEETDDDGAPVLGMTYDKDDRYIQVDVRDQAGTLVAVASEYVSVENADGSISFQPRELEAGQAPSDELTMRFVNVYEPAKASVALTGVKTLEGRDLVADEFRFLLYESAAGFPDLAEEVQPLCRASNKGDGSFGFEALQFAQVGTYYYQVIEDASTPLDNIAYDSTRYGVAVTVSDNGSGTLQADAAITRISDHVMVDAISFANTYAVPGGDPDDPDSPNDPVGPDAPKPGDSHDPAVPGGGAGSDSGLMADTGDSLGGILLLVIAALAASSAVILLVVARQLRR